MSTGRNNNIETHLMVPHNYYLCEIWTNVSVVLTSVIITSVPCYFLLPNFQFINGHVTH